MTPVTPGQRVTPPDDAWVKQVCLFGQGARCCRFLMMGGNGFSCEKFTPGMANLLLAKILNRTYHSEGDNCQGRSSQ